MTALLAGNKPGADTNLTCRLSPRLAAAEGPGQEVAFCREVQLGAATSSLPLDESVGL